MFPKPKDIKQEPVHVQVFPDGREVCNNATVQGRREYVRRVHDMVVRQGYRCCLEAYAPMCPGVLPVGDASFEHEWGRGMGGSRRDDRIEINGKWVNGAAHVWCNKWKSSRYIDYNRVANNRRLREGLIQRSSSEEG